jgi:predicted transcriptional regulator
VDTATSVDLERGTGLRQPEVSIAMRQLKPLDWIDEDEEKKPGKGRPNKVYSLKVRFKDIIAHLEKEQKKEIDDGMASIERLKELKKG